MPLSDARGRELRLPLDAAVEVLRDLNEFVVSLDRLGARRERREHGRFLGDPG